MLDWAKRLFIAYILTSPYYLFASGGLQISTFFLAAAIGLVFIHTITHQKEFSNVLKYLRKNWCLPTFIGCTVIINGIYYTMYQDTHFLLSSLYFIFNLTAIVMFFAIKKDKKFFNVIKLSLIANITIQLLIYVIGMGRYHPTDTFRYMGTFNDPNQLAFYVFLALIFIYTINFLYKSLRSRYDWIVWVAGTLIILLLASSTGVLLGLIAFFVALAAVNLKNIVLRIKKIASVWIIIGCVALVGLLGVGAIGLDKLGFNIPIVSRLQNKAVEADGRNILEDRGLDTVVYYPENLIYGSGEGDMDRFPKQKNGGNEIHSGLIALIFYYGIIPVVFLIKWLWDTIKKVDIRIKVAFLAILIESFTLINYRQPLLWILLVLPILHHAQSKPAKRS